MKVTNLLFAILTLAILGSCAKEESNNGIATAIPTIDSLIASDNRVIANSTKPVTLNCYAQGGDLTYLWEVELGDLFVTSEDGSSAQFSASACCLGDREITCTVTNSMGEASKSVVVTVE